MRPNLSLCSQAYIFYETLSDTDIFVHYGPMCNLFFIDAQRLKRKQVFFCCNNISQYDCFYCIFDFSQYILKV